jgi:hypothetical protein
MAALVCGGLPDLAVRGRAGGCVRDRMGDPVMRYVGYAVLSLAAGALVAGYVTWLVWMVGGLPGRGEKIR